MGSPHADGPTAQLLNAFEKALPSGAAVDRFDCFARSPLPCNDCRVCHRFQGCAQSDLDDFYALLENADGLVFAFPVYNLSFPAPMKALIDRTQRYWSARFIQGIRPPIAKQKKVVLITSAGFKDPESGILLERQLRPVLTVLNGKLAQSIHYAGADSVRPLEPFLAESAAAAQYLFGKTCL